VDQFVTERTFSTAENFMRALSPISRGWGGTQGDWIFRGLSDVKKYELVASALRLPPPILDYTASNALVTSLAFRHEDQVAIEYGLLWEFFRVADAQGLLIPEDSQIYRSPWAHKNIEEKLNRAKKGEGHWPFDELLSLAALAQHHRVPTRLLDWSNDAFVAAYFAASEASIRLGRWKKDQCSICGAEYGTGSKCPCCGTVRANADPDNLYLGVWCLNWRYVLKRWPGRDKADEIEVFLVMAPRATNPNLHAQGGVFTVHLVRPGDPKAIVNRDPLNVVISHTAQKTKDTRFPVMKLLRLPVSKADRLLRLLATQNIHAARIFPGFDGVVRHLNEWRLWDKPPVAGGLPIR
jgi:hypothetical protein